MASLKIKLCGIGICYEKDNCWNVLFPVNQDHRLYFFFDRFEPLKVALASPGRVIEIVADRGATPTGGGLNQLIDLTEQRSGAQNPGLHTNGIRATQDWRDHGVLLKVRGGILHQYDRMRSRYLLTKDDNPHRPAENFGYSAEIILPGNDFFSMTSSDGGALPIVGTSQINFDNSCPNCPAADDDDADFSMVYNVIEDAGNRRTKFKLERHPQDAPQDTLDNELVDRLAGFGSVVKIETNNPEPGVAGLPCNLVGASDSNGLP